MNELASRFLPYCDHEYANREDNAWNCEDEADKYAIEFLEWCNNHSDDDWKYGKFRNKTSQEILLIFKKEKNL